MALESPDKRERGRFWEKVRPVVLAGMAALSTAGAPNAEAANPPGTEQVQDGREKIADASKELKGSILSGIGAFEKGIGDFATALQPYLDRLQAGKSISLKEEDIDAIKAIFAGLKMGDISSSIERAFNPENDFEKETHLMANPEKVLPPDLVEIWRKMQYLSGDRLNVRDSFEELQPYVSGNRQSPSDEYRVIVERIHNGVPAFLQRQRDGVKEMLGFLK